MIPTSDSSSTPSWSVLFPLFKNQDTRTENLSIKKYELEADNNTFK